MFYHSFYYGKYESFVLTNQQINKRYGIWIQADYPGLNYIKRPNNRQATTHTWKKANNSPKTTLNWNISNKTAALCATTEIHCDQHVSLFFLATCERRFRFDRPRCVRSNIHYLVSVLVFSVTYKAYTFFIKCYMNIAPIPMNSTLKPLQHNIPNKPFNF